MFYTRLYITLRLLKLYKVVLKLVIIVVIPNEYKAYNLAKF